jgi:hypothetical protein
MGICKSSQKKSIADKTLKVHTEITQSQECINQESTIPIERLILKISEKTISQGYMMIKT